MKKTNLNCQCHQEPKSITGVVHFPIPLTTVIDKNTTRLYRGFKFTQFPLNIANARTIHKLQGRSISALIISSWDYTGNWIYVALSRVRTKAGLFLRLALDHSKCRGMSEEVKEFMQRCRSKAPDALPASTTCKNSASTHITFLSTQSWTGSHFASTTVYFNTNFCFWLRVLLQFFGSLHLKLFRLTPYATRS